jgi:hypothetical protein
MYVEVEDIYILHNSNTFGNNLYVAGDGYYYTSPPSTTRGPDMFTLGERASARVRPENSYPFAEFFTVRPASVKNRFFNNPDNFVISNPEAVKVQNGRIHIMKNARHSDNGWVTLEARYGDRHFFTVDIRIESDNDRFDYFSYNVDLLQPPVAIGSGDVMIVEDGKMVLELGVRPTGPSPKVVSAFGILVGDGVDHDFRTASPPRLTNTYTFASSNEAVLRVHGPGGAATAEIRDYGEVRLTITTDFAGSSRQTFVDIIIR